MSTVVFFCRFTGRVYPKLVLAVNHGVVRESAREKVGKMSVDIELSGALGQFAALVERVRVLQSLPCVCDESSEEAKEETLADCAPCLIESAFDETLEHALGVVEFLESRSPVKARAKAIKKTNKCRNNVIRFQPLSKQLQADAVWKY
jgi:hypothetical protein